MIIWQDWHRRHDLLYQRNISRQISELKSKLRGAQLDIERVKATVRNFRLKTCLANSCLLIYFLRILGEEATLTGMFRVSEDIPFHYLVLTEKWGKIDIMPFSDECDEYEGTRIANEGDYERGLSL